MGPELVIAIVAMGTTLVFVGGAALLVTRFFVRVRASEALVVHGPREPRVSFTGMLVLPFQSHEIVDLSAKEIVVDRRGRDSLRCHDSLRADVIFSVSLAVDPTVDDVVRAARALGGGDRTANLEAVRSHFETKIAAALAEVVRAVDYEGLESRRAELADRVLDVLGKDLDGYRVGEAHFAAIHQTPIEMLDPDDILDAVAIRKVTERAGSENARTREIRLERARAESAAELTRAQASLATVAVDGGSYRSDVAACEARVGALEADLAEARLTLAALREK